MLQLWLNQNYCFYFPYVILITFKIGLSQYFTLQIIQNRERLRRASSKVFRDAIASNELPVDLQRKFIIQFPGDDAHFGHTIHEMVSVYIDVHNTVMYFL